MLSKKYPALFVAYDILYYDGKQITDMPLLERKKILDKAFKENEFLIHTQYIEEQGNALFKLSQEQELEGIIAKRKDSIYRLDSKTKDWVKIKNLKDDDFVVCGYIPKESAVASIILGQYDGGKLVYIGRVTLGVSREEYEIISQQPEINPPFIKSLANAVYVKPTLVCVAKFMEYTKNGGLRQPIFKGLRFDKTAKECVVKVQ